MASFFIKKITAAGKLLGSVLVILAGITLLLSFYVKKIDDIWKQLGLPQKEGTNFIYSSFKSGSLLFPSKNNFKNILSTDRKALAMELLNYTRQTIQSQDFRTEYERTRMFKKPTRQPKPPKTEEQVRGEKMAEAAKAIYNSEAAARNNADPEMKKTFLASIEYFKKSLLELKDPNNSSVKKEVQNQQLLYETQLNHYKASMQQWETDYPEDVTLLIRQRLQRLMEETKSVDYEAQLIEKNGKKYFTNPAYEAKSIYWKYAFRAGKEITEATRTFAQQWLKEL